MASNSNQELIEQLQILLDQAKMGKDPNDRFRAKSYKDAIEKIKAVPTKITEESQIPLTKTSKTYGKVVEFLEQGKIKQSQKILEKNKDTFDIYRELQLIAEVGPAKAKSLVDDHGIRSMEQLSENLHLLNDKQKVGFKYYKTDQLRIPRDEILDHQIIYNNIAKKILGLKLTITGSFRRGAKDSGDIDILLTHPNDNSKVFKQFVDTLISQKYLIDHLAYGEKKYMGYGAIYQGTPRRIDILYCPPHEYPFAILYFTGSGPFNVQMRTYATTLGYRLNEKGLIDNKTGDYLEEAFECEEDIFEYLGMDFVKPEERK